MQLKLSIRKIIAAVAWLLVSVCILLLLLAARQRELGHKCRQVVVTIKGAGDDLYLDKEDIIQAIQKASHTNIIREQLKNINLAKLEASLEKNAWI
ncbi:MAG TPA: hypothetical protein VEZ55_12180, partial [Chitinophagaceae bacterium]|nr:hypothetical protein [Chitinophagaceae bacterium]